MFSKIAFFFFFCFFKQKSSETVFKNCKSYIDFSSYGIFLKIIMIPFPKQGKNQNSTF